VTQDGDALTAMDEFLAYCDRCAPGFAHAVRGASTQDLQRMESVSGATLPPEYRGFLLRMGRTERARIAPFFADIEVGVESFEAFYLDPPVPPPANTVFLWTVDEDSEMFLGTGGPWATIHPVLSFSWPLSEETSEDPAEAPLPFVVSGSLFAFLYLEAFKRLRRPSLPEHAEVRENTALHDRTEETAADRRRRFIAIAERLGFQSLPHLDPDILLYDRPDAALSLFSSVLAEDVMTVDAENSTEARRIAEILADNLGARVLG
jgi:hypothetical protein